MTQAERMICLTADMLAGQVMTTRYIRDTYGVSRATSKRDLALLRRNVKTATRRPRQATGDATAEVRAA